MEFDGGRRDLGPNRAEPLNQYACVPAPAWRSVQAGLQKPVSYQLAEPVVRQTLTIRKNLLGTGHPDVAQALDILALVVTGEEKLADAEAAACEALATSRKTVGEHPLTTGLCLFHPGATSQNRPAR